MTEIPSATSQSSEQRHPNTETFLRASSRNLIYGRSFTWTIHNYSALKKGVDDTLVSARFTVGPHDETLWIAKFTPGGRTSDLSCYASLHLLACKLPGNVAFGKFRFKCCDVMGYDLVNGCESEYRKFTMTNDIPLLLRNGSTFDEGLIQNQKTLLNDEMDLIWDVILLSEDVTRQIPELVTQHEMGVLRDLETCFLDKRFTDMIVMSKGKEHPAHRAILGARSPVFKNLLAQMDQSEASQITIDDVESEVVNEMLMYIYTGKTPNITRFGTDLFVAADKYGLKSLKKKCEEYMCDGLPMTVAVAPECLRIAFLHNSGDRFKGRIVDFIRKNLKDVQQTEGWRDLVQQNPELVGEMFCFSLENV